MNDLDLRFDAAAVAEAVRQPPLDRLRTRAARRRNRRLAGSSALAMLVTAVVLPVALGRGGGGHSATPAPVPGRRRPSRSCGSAPEGPWPASPIRRATACRRWR